MLPYRLNWCTLRYMRSLLNADRQCLQGRYIYSKTGEWVPMLKRTIRLEIEEHWKPILQAENEARANQKLDGRDKFYALSMFPYPSGKLHMGHVRVYTISDAMARYHRLHGKQVIHPMGWDAFGLPAENAAIERKELPQHWTHRNIKSMRSQLDELCCSFDWHREVSTCDPSYYKWTQYIFLKMYEAGLVYQKEASVNWDPVDQTVLADEQIDEEERSWRSGATVEKRYLRQWYIKTSAYAKSLWDGLEDVRSDLWLDVMNIQRNWIGDCTGCRLDFRIKSGDGYLTDPLSVFTDTPEAMFGISHVALSHDHRYNSSEYHTEGHSTGDKDFHLDLQAEHPVTKEMIPVIVSQRTEFHRSNDSHLGIPSVLEVDRDVAEALGLTWMPVLSSDGDTLVNSQQLDGLSRKQGFDAARQLAKSLGFGGHLVSPFLRDWLISRQRYWGTPIPIIHCDNCKAVPVAFDDLPVELPTITDIGDEGLTSLKQQTDWLNTTCPRCGGPAHRETDTMDTFVDSSWYFLRYLDPQNESLPVSREQTENTMPVDLYVGGIEHAVLHLYYARFFTHFLHDIGLVSHREPFVNLLTQGMVRGKSYKVKATSKYLRPEEIDFSGETPVEKETGAKLVIEFEKMSKSKYNGVDPQEVLEQYGVDTTRICMLSNVAPKTPRDWSYEVFAGAVNWQIRMWSLVTSLVTHRHTGKQTVPNDIQAQLQEWETRIYKMRNEAVRIKSFHFNKTFLLNTAISSLHTYTSLLKKVPVSVVPYSVQYERAVADLVIMVSPLAPSFSAEMWVGLRAVASRNTNHNWDAGVQDQRYPTVDEDFPMRTVVRCNGVTIGKISVPLTEFNSLTGEEALRRAQQEDFYISTIGDADVSKYKFHIHRDYSAELQLSAPGVQMRTEKMTKQEKKMQRKVNELRQKGRR